MNLTLKAILARNNFNRTAAVHYCEDVMAQYPSLRAEYRALMEALLDLGRQA